MIGINDEVVDYYAQLVKKDFDLEGIIDIIPAEIEEFTTLPGIEVKTTDKNINKQMNQESITR